MTNPYSWDIGQNIIKAIPVTYSPNECQTENTPNVNIFNIQIFYILQNIKMAIPVTYWPSEWQTENTKKREQNIFNIKIFFIPQSKFYNLYFESWKENKQNDSEFVNLWVTDGQTFGPETHVQLYHQKIYIYMISQILTWIITLLYKTQIAVKSKSILSKPWLLNKLVSH